MLAVSNLGKRYGRRWVFRGLSFEVKTGERLVVLGHNGSGKSTLLRAIAGLLPATEGTVSLPTGDPRLTLGYAALEMALYPQLTISEHLLLVADLRGVPDRTNELLAMIGLEHAKDLPSASLSTGMKARLKLAIAVQARPALLLLDEPGASLDEAGLQLVQAIVDEQTSRGAIVVATNDPRERRMATHELVLES